MVGSPTYLPAYVHLIRSSLKKAHLIDSIFYSHSGRLDVSETQSIYILINSKMMPSLTMTMRDIYISEKKDDGYLYLSYASQDVFG